MILSTQAEFETDLLKIIERESVFGSIEFETKKDCRMEGIVSRNIEEYVVEEFKLNVFKYVRKDHVKTDEHWSKAPKRSTLIGERKPGMSYLDDIDKIIKK